jgi:hypothetical protein
MVERVGSVGVRSSRSKLTGLTPLRSTRRGVVVKRLARLGVFHGFPRRREWCLHDRVDVLHIVRRYTTCEGDDTVKPQCSKRRRWRYGVLECGGETVRSDSEAGAEGAKMKEVDGKGKGK